MPRIARLFFLSVFFLLQAFCFRYNVLDVATDNQFERFAGLTESMVFARLAMSEQEGIFSGGALLLRDLDGSSQPAHHFQLQYDAYVLDQPLVKPHFYKSRSSLQTVVFSIFDWVSPFPDEQNISIFKWTVSIVSAACLTAFLAWILLVGHWSAAIVTALGALFSPWLTISGGHLFWVSGVFFLPFVHIAFLFHKAKPVPRPGYLAGSVALLFLIKSLLIGYELITASLVMCTLPVFYYAFRQKWTIRRWAAQFSIVSGGLLLGLALSMIILVVQTSQLDGHQRAGFGNIKERLMLRTVGQSTASKVPPQIQASQEATLGETMKKYWSQPLLTLPGLPKVLPGRHADRSLKTYWVLIFGILLGVSGLFFRPLRALSATTLISYLAPASWFIIFRAHAYLHPFLDAIAWFLPTVLLICALAGAFGAEALRYLGRDGQSDSHAQKTVD